MRRFLIVTTLVPSLLFGQEQQTSEEITVERIIVDTRVTDYDGDPVTDLTIDDFEVLIDGRRAEIVTAEWIPETEAARYLAGMDEEEQETREEPVLQRGRLLILFVQTDFARNGVRVKGHMKFLPYAEQIIENLEPNDRVAVFSFDSHLKFRLDFTSDPSEIKWALQQAIEIDDPAPPRVVPNPSLARRLDREAMKKCTSSDQAFILIANALRHIPDAKSMILLGWGLGHRVGGMVSMDHKYPIARRALEQSRVTVFALDTTDADYHDLEIGLSTAAADTGGFYAKTHIFPKLAVERLERTLSGHYELEVRKPSGLRPGVHSIEVLVARKDVYVMARTSYVD
jgi:VWFA-related protein